MSNVKILTEIRKIKQGESTLASDIIVREISFDIYINKNKLVTLSALPDSLKELAIGFLFSEGIVLSSDEISGMELNLEERYIHFQLDIPTERINNFHETGERTSGCGSSLSAALEKSGKLKFPELEIDSERILETMRNFISSSALFRETGGVHIAGLSRDSGIIHFAEDIGRHNAVDKVAGIAIQQKQDLSNFTLFCSGRISSEIVKKVVRLRIPIIVSKSAPTSEAVRLGWDYKIYLIGFARNNRMNIYTGYTDLIVK